MHFHWLWTRQGQPDGITYKPGFGPWSFLPIYLFDYGLAVLLGRGVQSLSRAFHLLGRHHWPGTGPLLFGSRDLWTS
jgi:hypothetical protein